MRNSKIRKSWRKTIHRWNKLNNEKAIAVENFVFIKTMQSLPIVIAIVYVYTYTITSYKAIPTVHTCETERESYYVASGEPWFKNEKSCKT